MTEHEEELTEHGEKTFYYMMVRGRCDTSSSSHPFIAMLSKLFETEVRRARAQRGGGVVAACGGVCNTGGRVQPARPAAAPGGGVGTCAGRPGGSCGVRTQRAGAQRGVSALVLAARVGMSDHLCTDECLHTPRVRRPPARGCPCGAPAGGARAKGLAGPRPLALKTPCARSAGVQACGNGRR